MFDKNDTRIKEAINRLYKEIDSVNVSREHIKILSIDTKINMLMEMATVKVKIDIPVKNIYFNFSVLAEKAGFNRKLIKQVEYGKNDEYVVYDAVLVFARKKSKSKTEVEKEKNMKIEERVLKHYKKLLVLLKDVGIIKNSKDIKVGKIENQKSYYMDMVIIPLTLNIDVEEFYSEKISVKFENILECCDFQKDYDMCGWGKDKKSVNIKIKIIFNNNDNVKNKGESFDERVTNFLTQLREGCQDLKDNANCVVQLKLIENNSAKVEMTVHGVGDMPLIENDIENANDEIYDMVKKNNLKYKHNEIWKNNNREVIFVIDLFDKEEKKKIEKKKVEKKEVELDGEMTVYEVGIKKIRRMTQKEFIKKFGKDETEGLKIWNKLRESFAEGSKYTNYIYGTVQRKGEKERHDVVYRLVKKINGQEAYLVAGLWLSLERVKEILK